MLRTSQIINLQSSSRFFPFPPTAGRIDEGDYWSAPGRIESFTFNPRFTFSRVENILPYWLAWRSTCNHLVDMFDSGLYVCTYNIHGKGTSGERKNKVLYFTVRHEHYAGILSLKWWHGKGSWCVSIEVRGNHYKLKFRTNPFPSPVKVVDGKRKKPTCWTYRSSGWTIVQMLENVIIIRAWHPDSGSVMLTLLPHTSNDKHGARYGLSVIFVLVSLEQNGSLVCVWLSEDNVQEGLRTVQQWTKMARWFRLRWKYIVMKRHPTLWTCSIIEGPNRNEPNILLSFRFMSLRLRWSLLFFLFFVSQQSIVTMRMKCLEIQ